MKSCPVCNIEVSDDYTGLCTSAVCLWEFELFGGDISPILLKEYRTRLYKTQRLFELSEKVLSNLSIKKLESKAPEQDNVFVKIELYDELILHQGLKYRGEIKRGNLDGIGVLYLADGNRYEGEFKENLINGLCIIHLNNGYKFIGEFLDDKKNGLGIHFSVDGRIIRKGIWKNNKYAKHTEINEKCLDSKLNDNTKYSQSVQIKNKSTKACPICNNLVLDDYTGLCSNPECLWEFQFNDGNLSPERQKLHEDKLQKAKAIYFKHKSTNEPNSVEKLLTQMQSMQNDLNELKRVSAKQDKIGQKNNYIELYDIEMIFVPGGTFEMGSNFFYVNEKPQHNVEVSDFYIGKSVITQAQWKAVTGKNPSFYKGDNLPIESISWNDTQDFIRRLNQRTGKKYRLPTEAEWEYAAGGGSSDRTIWAGTNSEDILGTLAWYNINSNNQTQSVKTKKPNNLGLHDLSGNVWEWCNDWYKGYNSSNQTNPIGPVTGTSRAIRGGCWSNNAKVCRISGRSCCNPDASNNIIGFRIILTE
jgi:formylglycine-generating enzyme required for sulfatase activity